MEPEEFQIQDVGKFQTNMLCSNCLKFLNVEPIDCIVDAYNIKMKCGRCCSSDINSNKCKILRQYAYESFARFITFPCSNKEFGCQAILDWDNVLKHERECIFQKVVCPLSYTMIFPDEKNCTWTGFANTLNKHIESAHQDSILNPAEIDWIIKKESNSIFFTKVGTLLITVVIKFETDNLQCLLMLNGSDVESQCFNYQLELFDENKIHSIMLRKNRLQSLFAMLDNIEMHDTMLHIEIGRIRDMLKTSGNIIGRFEIEKKKHEEIEQVTGLKIEELLNAHNASSVLKEIIQEIRSVDEELLQELACPVCHEFMVPPIYICSNGHSLCGTCQPQVTACPNCRGKMNTTRNVNLEKLTTRVYYPCHNKDDGCTLVTTSDTIRHHEEICRFKEMQCILSCGQICMAPAMMKHLVDKHTDKFLSPDQTEAYMIADSSSVVRVLKAYGELFHLSIQGSGQNPYKFDVYHLCMDKDKEAKFKYNIKISNPSKSSKSMNLTDVCPIWLEDRGSKPSGMISVPWALLESYIHEDSFSYNVVITKN